MYYELIVLGGLMSGPYHGYFLAKVMSDMLGPWQKVSTGSLYPLLARMVRAGLIEPVEGIKEPVPHERHRPRAYAITDPGRQRFHAIMLDTQSNAGDYGRLFRTKVLYFQFLTAAERADLIDHYRDYCRAAIRHQQTETADLRTWLAGMERGDAEPTGLLTAAGARDAIDVMDHSIASWQREYEWTDRLRERHLGSEPEGAGR